MFRAGALGGYAAATARPAGIIFFYRDGSKKKFTLVQVKRPLTGPIIFFYVTGFKQQFILVLVKSCCDCNCGTAGRIVLGEPLSINTHISNKQ